MRDRALAPIALAVNEGAVAKVPVRSGVAPGRSTGHLG